MSVEINPVTRPSWDAKRLKNPKSRRRSLSFELTFIDHKLRIKLTAKYA